LQQKLEYFHTEKNLKETEEILAKEKMEIIFSSKDTFLSIHNLNAEEKIAYFEATVAQTKCGNDRLQHAIQLFNSVEKRSIKFVNDIKELIKTMKENPNSFKTNLMFNEILKTSYKLRNKNDQVDGFSFYRYAHNLPTVEIHCKCIIAKVNNNIVRYLEFLDDPVITITGPRASNLKSTLEKKF